MEIPDHHVASCYKKEKRNFSRVKIDMVQILLATVRRLPTKVAYLCGTEQVNVFYASK